MQAQEQAEPIDMDTFLHIKTSSLRGLAQAQAQAQPIDAYGDLNMRAYMRIGIRRSTTSCLRGLAQSTSSTHTYT